MKHKKPKHDLLTEAAISIVQKLRKKGHEAYFAGGYVRDLLMKRKRTDIDIATNATPDQIIKIFPKTIEVGKQFGVIIVLYKKFQFEVATFRSDFDYKDGRRPTKVKFVTAEEDVKRRDFTINGMLYDPIENKVLDWVGGKKDISKKIICTIGNPADRFCEDKLRILRAVRFASTLSFKIDKKTKDAVKKLSKNIKQISAERIRDELIKIFTGANPDKGLLLLDKTSLLKTILPEVSKMKGIAQPDKFHPEGDVFDHTLLMLKLAKNPSCELAFAVLLHDVAKPLTMTKTDRIRFNEHDIKGAEIAKKIMRRLKFSNAEIKTVYELIKNHMRFMHVKKMRESKIKRFLSMEDFPLHLELHRLDVVGSHGKLDVYNFCKKKLKEYSKAPIIPRPLITGADLIKLGFKPGPIFKNILEFVKDLQLENKIKTKKKALKQVQNKF